MIKAIEGVLMLTAFSLYAGGGHQSTEVKEIADAAHIKHGPYEPHPRREMEMHE